MAAPHSDRNLCGFLVVLVKQPPHGAQAICDRGVTIAAPLEVDDGVIACRSENYCLLVTNLDFLDVRPTTHEIKRFCIEFRCQNQPKQPDGCHLQSSCDFQMCT